MGKRPHIGLYGLIAVQKDKAHVIAWNLTDEALRVLDHASDAAVNIRYVKRMFGCQYAKLFRRETAMPRDFGKHFFRRQSRKATNRRADHGAKRQNTLVDGYKVDDVAGFPAVRGCGGLICSKVNGV